MEIDNAFRNPVRSACYVSKHLMSIAVFKNDDISVYPYTLQNRKGKDTRYWVFQRE